MKLKLIVVWIFVLFVAAIAFASDTVYHCEEDSCGKCEVSKSTMRCGKCGGNMHSRDMRSVPGTSTIEAWFECDRCSHKSKWIW